jgi:fatty acid desaturase
VNDPAWYQPFLDAVGWVPAVVFPAASVLQLMALLRRGKADGVSVLTWSLFAVANVCLYLTVAEWTRPQVIATTLGTALVQVVVVMTALRLRADKAAPRADSTPKA